MSSTRLPGKVLFKLGGYTVIEQLLLAVLQVCDRQDIIVALPLDRQSDDLAEFLKKKEFTIFRGDELNVASRFLAIIRQRRCDYFIRLSGDSPLLDHRIIKEGLEILATHSSDLITTVGGTPFPSGVNVEIVNAKTFLRAYPHFKKPEHFEHVTKYFYENKSSFNIYEVHCQINEARRFKFSLDEKQDHRLIKAIFGMIDKPHYAYTLQQKCDLFEKAKMTTN